MAKNMLSSKVKNRMYVFWKFYRLSTKTYFCSPINVFLGIFLFYFITLIWLLYRSTDPFILASATGAITVRNAIHMLYRNLNIHRETGFSSKVDFLPVSPFRVLFANILANFVIVFIANSGLILITYLAYPHQRTLIANVNWSMYISSILMLYFLMVILCYIMYIYIKDPMVSMILANVIYIFTWYFLGCAYPYNIVTHYKWLNIVMYAFPPRYMMNVMQAGWVNAPDLKYVDTFNTSSHNYSVEWNLGGNLAIPYAATIGIILFFGFFLVLHFLIKLRRRTKDDYGTSIILKLSNRYIRDIKRCSSIEQLANLRSSHLKEMGYSNDNLSYDKIIKWQAKDKKHHKPKHK
ncbi:hypothetical protein [Spiroplasma tabanidicola]|uniref:Uncharacterized protein n=1 Tax=Spiroplasma tabanidicola TaxID=324079 RepID=A0A6I6CB31_9MOLU|nr:hypothetical protein [Spiroplasma tabanidicola]QGS52141.1 hypothetical protein STABA_v1c07850 [Spiroplasma tabanidicola]